MCSLTTTSTKIWFPNSNQLQFNFKFRKSPTPLNLLRVQVPSFDYYRHFRVLCVAQNGSGSESERRRSGKDSWASVNSSADVLSDWFGSSEQSSDSQQKQEIGGIVGAGLAGFFLVAGITFAALSIGKRSSSRSRQEMEPLTKRQEMLLTSAEEVCREEENKIDVKYNVQDERELQNNGYLESKTGTEKDLALSSESTEYDSGRKSVDYTEVEPLSELEKSTSNSSDSSVQKILQSDSVLRDANTLNTSSTSHVSSELDSVDGSNFTSSFIDSQNFLAVTSTEEKSDMDPEPQSIKYQQGETAATQADTFGTTLEALSSIFSQASNSADFDGNLETQSTPSGDVELAAPSSSKEDGELAKAVSFSGDSNSISIGIKSSEENVPSGTKYSAPQSSQDIPGANDESDVGRSVFESESPKYSFTSRGIPAPSLLSAALQTPPVKVLVPAVVDQNQGQALAALQVLKVIENDAQPGELCTRREYARWLVSASSALSRNSISKVYPAMYMENVTELAFDDITPEDPDFTSIQGLAEAGLISSKLSRRDMLSSLEEDIGPYYFHPDSSLSRQDLVTWKMALEKRELPEADRKILHQLSGFIDIDRIDPDACPALVADLSAGENGIVALAFGYTRLFQPNKPVTKGQAAIALSTGEATDVVSEELARIEAESIAENAVAAHNALVAEVEKDINASFEKELLLEREKIDFVEKMAEEARREVERLRGEREGENIALMKERAAIESEMEVLSKLRSELEEQLQSLMSNKVEISYEKERIEKLRKATEEENQAISRLQYELEVERKALSMARTWAEDEAKRVQEHAKALEEARDRWEKQGIKVVVDEDLREDASAEMTWLNVGKQLSVEGTVGRAENLTDKLKAMAAEVGGRSKEVINKIIEKIQLLVSIMKEWICEAGKRTNEFVQDMQQRATGLSSTVKEGAKRVVGDCRDGVEKLTQRFKT